MKKNDSALDLDLAAGVQKILFPKSSPICSWGEIGLKNRMAQGVGGDYFDFLAMADKCQVIFLGDVTGHGLHASLIMALLYGYIHRAFQDPCPCRDIVNQVNDFLLSFAARSRELDQFFSSTLFYAVINPETRAMTYVNAGHPAPLVRRGDSLLSLPPTAPPLGYFEKSKIFMERIDLKAGDRLLLYTDGITEATDRKEIPFGAERLERILLASDCDHTDLLQKLFAELDEFTEIESPNDDCTAIVVDFHSRHSGRKD